MLADMFRKFIAEWSADWTGRMSGTASIVLTFWVTFFPPTADGARWLLLATAILCFILGSYHVWARERRELEAERAKNEHPDIYGEIQDFVISPLFPVWNSDDAPDADGNVPAQVAPLPKPIGSVITMNVYFVNKRQVATTIKTFMLVVRDAEKTHEFPYPDKGTIRQEQLSPPYAEVFCRNLYEFVSSSLPVEYHRGNNGCLRFMVEGILPGQFTSTSDITLKIIDALESAHDCQYVEGILPRPSEKVFRR